MADDHADQRAEHEHAEMPDLVGGQLGAKAAGARHEVGAVVEDRLHDAAKLLGLVLAVGVDRGDDPRSARPGQPVAQPQRRALSPVDRDVADQRAGLASLRRGGVLGAVDDDDHLGREARGFARDLGDHLGDGGRLVVGRDHDRKGRAGTGRVRRQELARGVALSGLQRGDLGVDVERLGGRGHVLLALLACEAHFTAPAPGRPTAPEPANTASWSICDHSCHTPTSPSSKVN